jgi:hypothetical protein
LREDFSYGYLPAKHLRWSIPSIVRKVSLRVLAIIIPLVLVLTLTDESLDATHIGYTYTWISHLPETSSDPLVVPLLLSTGFDPLSTLTKLVQNASKGLYFYFSVTSDSAGADSSTVVYKLPTDTAKTTSGWVEKLARSPFYLNLSLAGQAASTGESSYHTTMRTLPESLEIGYFTDKYKIDLTGRYTSTSMSLPSGNGGNITATDRDYGINSIEVYSFSKHWNVAVLETTSADPGSNIHSLDAISTGVEWTLVPFRTSENKELAFRVGPSFSKLNLEAPNALNHLDERYLGAFSQIYFYWVGFGDRIQGSTSASYNENFKYKSYDSYSVNGSLTYNFNSIFSLTASIVYSDSPRSITFPGNPNYSNPLQSLFLSGQPGSSVSYIFGFNAKLGNSVRKARDRRWSTTSN